MPTTLTGVEAEAAQPAGSARPWAGRGTVRSQPALRPHLLLLLHCQLASKPHPHQAGDPDTTGETADHSATIPFDSGRWWTRGHILQPQTFYDPLGSSLCTVQCLVAESNSCAAGLLSHELPRQQPQSRHDVQQHQHSIRPPLQSTATDSHSDTAATATTATATAAGPHQECPVADHHQLCCQSATQYQQQGGRLRL